MGIISKIESLIVKWRNHVKLTQKGPAGNFWRNGGNDLLISSLPICTTDIVVDAGGYKGEWADQILARYGAKVVVFEPVPVFYQGLRIHYVGNDRVSVRATALARTAGKASIAFSDNGSSIFGKQASMLEIDLESLEDYILSEGISTIACLKLNIEGSEYDVLEGLIERRLIHRISCLLIQFHTIEERSKLRRSEIQAQLAKTHTKVFDYPFVWERWDSRKDS